MGVLTNSVQRLVTTSNNTSFCESLLMAAINFPSGDHRGEKSCAAPGRGETFRVCRSTIAIPGPEIEIPGETESLRVTTTDLPSGDQPGSKPACASGTSS